MDGATAGKYGHHIDPLTDAEMEIARLSERLSRGRNGRETLRAAITRILSDDRFSYGATSALLISVLYEEGRVISPNTLRPTLSNMAKAGTLKHEHGMWSLVK